MNVDCCKIGQFIQENKCQRPENIANLFKWRKTFYNEHTGSVLISNYNYFYNTEKVAMLLFISTLSIVIWQCKKLQRNVNIEMTKTCLHVRVLFCYLRLE